jgi:hypothetical protein
MSNPKPAHDDVEQTRPHEEQQQQSREPHEEQQQRPHEIIVASQPVEPLQPHERPRTDPGRWPIPTAEDTPEDGPEEERIDEMVAEIESEPFLPDLMEPDGFWDIHILQATQRFNEATAATEYAGEKTLHRIRTGVGEPLPTVLFESLESGKLNLDGYHPLHIMIVRHFSEKKRSVVIDRVLTPFHSYRADKDDHNFNRYTLMEHMLPNRMDMLEIRFDCYLTLRSAKGSKDDRRVWASNDTCWGDTASYRTHMMAKERSGGIFTEQQHVAHWASVPCITKMRVSWRVTDNVTGTNQPSEVRRKRRDLFLMQVREQNRQTFCEEEDRERYHRQARELEEIHTEEQRALQEASRERQQERAARRAVSIARRQDRQVRRDQDPDLDSDDSLGVSSDTNSDNDRHRASALVQRTPTMSVRLMHHLNRSS